MGIVAAILSQPGGRARSILLLQLCASDLLVCGVTVPVSAAALASSAWTLGTFVCKLAFFFQVRSSPCPCPCPCRPQRVQGQGG